MAELGETGRLRLLRSRTGLAIVLGCFAFLGDGDRRGAFGFFWPRTRRAGEARVFIFGGDLCYNWRPMFVSHRKSGLVAYDDTDLSIELDHGSL